MTKYIKIQYKDGTVGHIDTINMTEWRINKLVKDWKKQSHVISVTIETVEHNRIKPTREGKTSH
mgnify:CR=1 FL=1